MAIPELTPPRQAIERGDYGQALRALEVLADGHPVSGMEGTQVRLLMSTALMGLGRNAEALAQVRLIARCGDRRLRARARELVAILEAPTLERPAAWSMSLPDLAGVGSLEGSGGAVRRRRRPAPPPPPPPPVGATRLPVGFAVLVAALLLALTVLLSGCAEVELALEFGGPGRLRVQETLIAPSPTTVPWQRAVQEAWSERGGRPHRSSVDRARGGGTSVSLDSAVLPLPEATALVMRSLEQTAQRLGVVLAPPEVSIEERNWWIGVVQRGRIRLDLEPLGPLPGFNASVRLEPLPLRALRQVQGDPPTWDGPALIWPLRLGQINALEWRCWRWSPLGLGSLVIAALLGISLALRRLQLRAGGGYPGLPA
ncbi:DUF3153 domain-containing protein [Synechococcus sp. RSCCF101]|uniref:DUF3153 domain-containing protein n=1 Tax=Synechococcus sp. RSCCF101 TaxID=2511069 RepID=UPI00177F0264|nr:DUF3153 domain-containing protein [Synechococcus sp. RSCCF101]